MVLDFFGSGDEASPSPCFLFNRPSLGLLEGDAFLVVSFDLLLFSVVCVDGGDEDSSSESLLSTMNSCGAELLEAIFLFGLDFGLGFDLCPCIFWDCGDTNVLLPEGFLIGLDSAAGSDSFLPRYLCISMPGDMGADDLLEAVEDGEEPFFAMVLDRRNSPFFHSEEA